MQQRRSEFSIIDLFAGCGGNSWGMMQCSEEQPLTPKLALDIDPTALETYHLNIPDADLLQADICEVDASTLLNILGLRPGELGCIVASPPCQTYSRNNRLRKDRGDRRNTLYKHTLRLIEAIKPLTVFMENVPDMAQHHRGLHHEEFIATLQKLGYVVKSFLINAADYGVPQTRCRLIYLAYHRRMKLIPRCPEPSHGESRSQAWVTVEDAISDLPRRKAGESASSFLNTEYQDTFPSAFALARRKGAKRTIENHYARSLSSMQMARLHALREGEAYHQLPVELRPTDGYKASYGRLWRDRPSPTLTTYLSYPGSGRFSHYEQDRVITIREALRLQSFDDRFEVRGKLIEQSAQVGNAVPPLLAAAFGQRILGDIARYVNGKPLNS